MKKAFVAILLVLAAVLFLPFMSRHEEGEHQHVEGLPWQIEVQPDGSSKVFGLTLGRSILADARQRFGSDMELALIVSNDEAGSLEAYYDKVTAGVLTGKMVLTMAVDPATLTRFRERAAKKEYMETGAKKYLLDAGDVAAAYQAPIGTVTFILPVSIDEATVLKLFGQPEERIGASQYTQHFLYSSKGLDLMLNSKGKEVLQYVPPRDFQRLREPLIKAMNNNRNAR